ncbi:MAG: DUF935 family protein [Meiothermus sp.]|nr:DUF935 family protein [Meiothermus sp.]
MPILDQWGNPISSRPPQSEAPSPVVGLQQRFYSYPGSRLTPERLTRILREADDGDLELQAELFAEMEERDGKLFQLLQDRKLAVIGVEWQVEPADSSAEAKRIAEAFEETLKRLNPNGLMLELLDAIGQGVGMVGMAWRRDDGLWWPAQTEQIEAKHLRYDFDLKRFKVRTQDQPNGMLPEFGRVIQHRFKARSGLPTRAGLMRTNCWWYLFKHYSVKDWVVYAEVYGQPYRLGKYDPATGQGEKDALERAVRGLGTDAAGIISKDTEIEIIETARSGNSSEVFDSLIELANREMTLAVLGQTLTSGEGKHGTNALGNVHQKTRTDLLEADVLALGATLSRDLALAWTVFNFGTDKARLAPRVVGLVEEAEDLKAKSETLKNLQDIGMRISKSWAHRKFAVPEPETDDDVLLPPAPPKPAQNPPQPPPGGQATPRAANTRLAALERLEEVIPPGVMNGQQFVLELIGGATSAGQEAVSPALQLILREVEASRSPEDLRRRLIELFPELEVGRLRQVVEAGWLLSELAGMLAQREDMR